MATCPECGAQTVETPSGAGDPRRCSACGAHLTLASEIEEVIEVKAVPVDSGPGPSGMRYARHFEVYSSNNTCCLYIVIVMALLCGGCLTVLRSIF